MRIVTDSGAEFSAEELTQMNVIQAPLYINFPEGAIASGDIDADTFYDKLEGMAPAIPTTSLPPSSHFAEIYRTIAAQDKEILSIQISSGLSGTFNSALMGSKEVGEGANIQVFDSMTLSGAQRLQVLVAARAALAGWSMPRILERLEKIRAQSEAIYTLETLEYLARGGRIGRVAGLLGSLLKIKPVIHVDHEDGKYSTVGKTRNLMQALDIITLYLSRTYGTTPLWINVVHGRLHEMASILSGMLKEKLNVARLDILRVSPVLGVHTGPGLVGATVAPMEFFQDLM